MEVIKPGKYVKPSRFVKIENGENRVRLLSKGHLYWLYGRKMGGRYLSHIVRDGEKVPDMFLKPDKDGEIPEPKRKYGWIAYDFRQQRVCILEAGPMLGHKLAELCETDVANFTKRDIIIQRSGEGFNTKHQVSFAEDVQEPENMDKAAGETLKRQHFGEVDG